MIKKLKLIFPALIASLSLAGCDFFTIVDNDTDSGQKQDEVNYGTYYDGYDLTRTGGKLIIELQKNCWDKHKNYYTYGQFNAYCQKTNDHNSIEAVSNNSTKNQYFYTGKESSSYGTREHVWPCANSAGLWVHDGASVDSPTNVDYGGSQTEKYVGGGSDLLHVRTCTSSVNTKRGNTRFVSFRDKEHQPYAGGVSESGDGGKWKLLVNEGQKTCEPPDGMKGDCARIVAYVYVHYIDLGITPTGSFTIGSRTYKYSDMVGALALTSIFGYDSKERCEEVMKEWNKLDPPSSVEKLRNDTVQKLQGNRNPFVDIPDLMDKAFLG